MNTATLNPYSIETIQEEARYLVEKGKIGLQQHIYTLCDYIPAREWLWVEKELEKWDYLLRDRVCDLIGSQRWDDD